MAGPKNIRTGLGGVLLGKLFNIGGMGLTILMALDSVMNFKTLFYFSIIDLIDRGPS